MKQYKRVLQDDITLNRIQDSVEDFVGSIIFPYLPGINIIKNVFINSIKDNYVSHKLNRPLLGYIIINRNVNTVIYTSGTANANENLYIILRAPSDVTVDILFF